MKTPTTKAPAVKCIKLADIDTSLTVRAETNLATVSEYAEAMLDTANKFPPIAVFDIGNGKLLCADGSHRVEAARRNKFIDIAAEIRTGSRSDALKYALGSNVAHGLRRTNADKRQSVTLALAEWPKMADREIAKMCAVGDHLVSELRKEMTANCVIPAVEKRVGADGKTRSVPKPPKRKPPVINVESEVSPAEPSPDAIRKRLEDGMGLEIPDKCRAVWAAGEEVSNWIQMVKSVEGKIKNLQEDSGDFLFQQGQVNAQSLFMLLGNVVSQLEAMKPYAVCTCLGKQGDACMLCKGKGLLGKFYWHQNVPEETRNLRKVWIAKRKQEGK